MRHHRHTISTLIFSTSIVLGIVCTSMFATSILIADDSAARADIRFADTSRLLTYLGFASGVIDPGSTGDMQIDYTIETTFGGIEQDRAIDTPEELITATYYSMPAVSTENARRFDDELPKDATGAFRLCAMWLFKMGENPPLCNQYRRAIQMIIARSKIDVNAVVDYYCNALKKKIDAPAIDLLTLDEQTTLRERLTLYFCNPAGPTEFKSLRTYILFLENISVEKYRAACGYIATISPPVAVRLQQRT